MWKNVRIATKILLSIGLVLIIMIVPVALLLINQDEMIVRVDNISNDNHLELILLEREVDHLKWVQALSAYILNPKEMELKVQQDHTKCAFGKWYYGKERTDTENKFKASSTMLKDIEEPHRLLHASSVTIQDLRKRGEQDKLVQVFFADSVTNLSKVQAKLKDIREVVDSAVSNETKKMEEANASSKRNSLIVVVAVILVAILGGVATTLSITRPLRKSVAFALKIASGFLNEHLEIKQKDEVGVLADCLGRMVTTLKEKIDEAEKKTLLAEEEAQKARLATQLAEEERQHAVISRQEGLMDAANRLQAVVESITYASDQLNAQSSELSKNSDTQAERVSETATAMEEMNSTILEVARNAGQATTTSENAKNKALEGEKTVVTVINHIKQVEAQSTELKSHMDELSKRADDIGKIMNVINDIADQTNLLALNAAIEAARAGEAGRGFAVVADEVRKLAEKTMTATKEVGSAIQGIQDGTRVNAHNVESTAKIITETTSLAANSGEVLKAIVDFIEVSSDQIRSIATASEEQSATSEEINRNIADVDNAISASASMMHESAKAVDQLAHQAHILKQLIEELQSEGGVAPGQRALM
jgi:methyl-accepting chemotaxis protein